MTQNTTGPHRPPDTHLAAEDRARHRHHDDLTAEMVRADPLFTEDPEGNPFYADLCRSYPEDDDVRALWDLAAMKVRP